MRRFEFEQFALALEAPSVAAEMARSAECAMAGIAMATGFAPLAVPTARIACGRPIRRAISVYERVLPEGIARSLFQTRNGSSAPRMSFAQTLQIRLARRQPFEVSK